ncbi:MAG: glycosyl hydrolase [Actinomycetota bacterium]|nr:glycosyl hydrolase [Actinomycetota bacterium]
MTRLVRLLLTAVVAAALMAPLAEAKVPKDFVGVQDDSLLTAQPDYRTTNLRTMRGIGVGSIRQAFNWRDIETAPGQYDFSLYDELVAKASAQRLKILGVIFGPPSFRMKKGPGKFTCPPKSNKAFGNYAALLAKRYGSRGTFWRDNPTVPRNPIRSWQIWNEPNLRPYWCGKPSAKQYVSLLRAAHKALSKADRTSETVTAGLPQSKLGISLLKYVDQMYRARGKNAFDTLAIHNYSRNIKEFRKRLRDVRKVMNRRGDRRAKIWVTEISWSDVGPGSPFRVGTKRQGKLIADALKVVGRERNRLRLRGAMYVFWRDLPPYPPNFRDFWGLHTGLLRADGSRKPAYSSFRKAVARLRK